MRCREESEWGIQNGGVEMKGGEWVRRGQAQHRLIDSQE